MAKDSTGLGTFTGSTISDASTIKAALQDLETGVEAAQAGSAVADRTKTTTDSTDATRYSSLLWQMIMHLLLLKVCSPTLALRITRQAIPNRR